MADTTISLDKLALFEKAVIIEFTDELVSQHLMEMGCLPGQFLYVNNVAPLGDPISIVVDGFTLSIRKQDAAAVIVSKVA
jgi:ferrous iron transport protein A